MGEPSGHLRVRVAELEDLTPFPSEFTQRVLLQMERVLKGAKPADLPMTQVTRFYLTVNLKTAKALGIKLPQSVLARAGSIFE